MRNNHCIKIYKYRSLSGEHGREAIENAVKRNELYWQSPSEFNDPFDCAPVLYFGDNDHQRKKFYARATAAVYHNQTRTARRQHRRNIGTVPPAEMEKQLREAWGGWLTNSAIACFSEVHDHPLMWGHYADSHKGVCLIFEEFADDQAEWFAFPVAYQAARPRVNLTCFNDPQVMMQALLLKSNHWSYEREQRMIAWNKAPGYRDFPVQSLTGIILGAKISEANEAFVRSLLPERPDLQLFRAEIDATAFKLEVVPA